MERKKLCGIYAFVDEDNRVYYVGRSKDIIKRLKQHYSEIRHSSSKMHQLLRYATSDPLMSASMGLKVVLLQEVPERVLKEAEDYYIAILEPVLNTKIPKDGVRFIHKIECLNDAIYYAEMESFSGTYFKQQIADLPLLTYLDYWFIWDDNDNVVIAEGKEDDIRKQKTFASCYEIPDDKQIEISDID